DGRAAHPAPAHHERLRAQLPRRRRGRAASHRLRRPHRGGVDPRAERRARGAERARGPRGRRPVSAYVERLRALGLDPEVGEFPEGPHTAQEAADATGCTFAAIVKWLVFTLVDEQILVLVSGAN